MTASKRSLSKGRFCTSATLNSTLLSTPFLFALSSRLRDLDIHLLCRSYVSPVYRRCSAVDNLVEYERTDGVSGALGAIPPLYNFTVSNVVLSKQPLYLGGAKLDMIVPVSFLFDGYGLNVTLVGYTDKVALGFVGCRDTVPSLQRLAQYTRGAFEELEQAAQQPTPTTK